MSHQTTVKLEISAGHILEFQVNTRRLAEELCIPENEEIVFKDLEASQWYINNEPLLIQYFPAVVLAVLDHTLNQAVDLYSLEEADSSLTATDVITLTVHHWG